MGSLFAVSFFTLGILFSFVFFILILIQLVTGSIDLGLAISLTVAINFVLWLVGPWFTDWINRWFYKVTFLKPDEVAAKYPAVAEIITQVTQTEHFPHPKVGIISDRNPTAFSYGSGRWNARIIVTEGIFEFLTPEEVKAVVAHELGHVRNRDFIVMMVGSTVVQILYELYAFLARGNDDRDKGSSYLRLIGLLSYVLYLVGTYLLLFLSRTREYLADQFSAETTQDPEKLSSALIKIAYGIVTAHDSGSSTRLLESTRHMGLVDIKNAKFIGAAVYVAHSDPEILSEVMVFDRVSPWAFLIELNSTHPLTGKRIARLGTYATSLGKSLTFNVEGSIARLNVDYSRLRRGFIFGVLMYFAPVLGALIALAFLPLPMVLAGVGAGILVQTLYRYPQNSPVASTVLEEMRNPYASPIQGKRVVFQGQVIGRGVPGFVFGSDMMFQDQTGLVFLRYSSIFGFIGNLFFAIGKIRSYIGKASTAKGWFFRGMGSEVALSELSASDGLVRSHPIFWSVFVAGLLFASSMIFYFLASSGGETNSDSLNQCIIPAIVTRQSCGVVTCPDGTQKVVLGNEIDETKTCLGHGF